MVVVVVVLLLLVLLPPRNLPLRSLARMRVSCRLTMLVGRKVLVRMELTLEIIYLQQLLSGQWAVEKGTPEQAGGGEEKAKTEDGRV